MTPEEGMERLFPGCPALNEVFLFMAEEGPFDHILGKMYGLTVGFRNVLASRNTRRHYRISHRRRFEVDHGCI